MRLAQERRLSHMLSKADDSTSSKNIGYELLVFIAMVLIIGAGMVVLNWSISNSIF
jgi:hypothetical protein